VIHGGVKFCIAPDGGCTFKSHQKKADVEYTSVYLTVGTLRHGKATGFTGWFAREAVFGNRWGKLKQLSLFDHSFWRFGGTIGAMFDDGRDPVGIDWEIIVLYTS
jgi:hypothetical protein